MREEVPNYSIKNTISRNNRANKANTVGLGMGPWQDGNGTDLHKELHCVCIEENHSHDPPSLGHSSDSRLNMETIVVVSCISQPPQ